MEESEYLLHDDSRTARTTPRTQRQIGTIVLCVTTFGFIAVKSLNQPQTNIQLITTNYDKSDHGWYMYKTAFPASSSSLDTVFSFMQKYSGGYQCQKDSLGCDAYKITCSFGGWPYKSSKYTAWKSHVGLDRQIHFVVAPRLLSEAIDNDGIGTDGWQKIAEESFGNMSAFSPFMHNKVQVYTSTLTTLVNELKEAGYNIMTRWSVHGDGAVGHVSVPIAGKIFEFVGFCTDASEGPHSTIEDCEAMGFVSWSPEECPAAHKVDANLTHLYAMTNQSPNPYVPGAPANWKGDKQNSSLWISTGVAVSKIPTSGNGHVLLDSFSDVTDAQNTYYQDDYCAVVTITYDNIDDFEEGAAGGDDVSLRVVQNFGYQELENGYSLKEYERYIAQAHKRYLSKPKDEANKYARWRNWDHWLDQHIGLKWKNESGCESENQQVTEMILDEGLYCGKRGIENDGDHFYVAFDEIPMTIEYNTDKCSHGYGETGVCACVRENSNLLAEAINETSSCDVDDDQF